MILQDMTAFCLAVAELWSYCLNVLLPLQCSRACVFDSLVRWQDLTYICLGDTVEPL